MVSPPSAKKAKMSQSEAPISRNLPALQPRKQSSEATQPKMQPLNLNSLIESELNNLNNNAEIENTINEIEMIQNSGLCTSPRKIAMKLLQNQQETQGPSVYSKDESSKSFMNYQIKQEIMRNNQNGQSYTNMSRVRRFRF